MITSRRGLFGMFAAGAAAAIIRTPGLLMPVKVPRMLTLADWARMQDKIVNPPIIADLLAEHSAILDDLSWMKPGAVFTVGTPPVKWRALASVTA